MKRSNILMLAFLVVSLMVAAWLGFRAVHTINKQLKGQMRTPIVSKDLDTLALPAAQSIVIDGGNRLSVKIVQKESTDTKVVIGKQLRGLANISVTNGTLTITSTKDENNGLLEVTVYTSTISSLNVSNAICAFSCSSIPTLELNLSGNSVLQLSSGSIGKVALTAKGNSVINSEDVNVGSWEVHLFDKSVLGGASLKNITSLEVRDNANIRMK